MTPIYPQRFASHVPRRQSRGTVDALRLIGYILAACALLAIWRLT